LGALVVVALLVATTVTIAAPTSAQDEAENDSTACVLCHRGMNPTLIEQYEKSEHAGTMGASCLDCHLA
jgi:nitrate/TMAO reductase-like tetraheme cytochrome c subunit